MTGTGTSVDPYIVTTFTDFISATATDGTYVEFDSTATNKIIDINNTLFCGGLTGTITLNCAHVAGNGWVIRNLYVNSDIDVFVVPNGKNTMVEELHLLNMVLTIPGKYLIDAYASIWKRCTFSGIFNRGTKPSRAVYSRSSSSLQFQYCSFYTECTGSGALGMMFIGASYDTCNFDVSAQIEFYSSSQGLFVAPTLLNCIVKGNIGIGDTSSTGLSVTSGGDIRTSYFILTLTNTRADGDVNVTMSGSSSGNFNSVCFYNADLIGERINVRYVQPNLKALATEQCKDAAYLTNIGFPCVEVTA